MKTERLFDLAWYFVALFHSTTKAKEMVSLATTKRARQILQALEEIEKQEHSCYYCHYEWTGKEAGPWPCPNCGSS